MRPTLDIIALYKNILHSCASWNITKVDHIRRPGGMEVLLFLSTGDILAHTLDYFNGIDKL
jgi:hypothetical protein